jgi:hypothetical protein
MVVADRNRVAELEVRIAHGVLGANGLAVRHSDRRFGRNRRARIFIASYPSNR